RGGRDAGAPHARRRGARMAGMRPFSTIRYEKRGPIALVTLDRPEVLNAYDVAMRDGLGAALGAADEDPDVRVLVLRGAGPAFSSGGDVREFGTAPSPVVARIVRWRRDVWGRLVSLRAATVASVHGHAVGGGMEMAMLCDLCIAADDAGFALPETGLGMIPGVGGTQTLPRRAGVGRAPGGAPGGPGPAGGCRGPPGGPSAGGSRARPPAGWRASIRPSCRPPGGRSGRRSTSTSRAGSGLSAGSRSG